MIEVVSVKFLDVKVHGVSVLDGVTYEEVILMPCGTKPKPKGRGKGGKPKKGKKR